MSPRRRTWGCQPPGRPGGQLLRGNAALGRLPADVDLQQDVLYQLQLQLGGLASMASSRCSEPTDSMSSTRPTTCRTLLV